MRHVLRALSINGQNDISWAQVCQGCFTARVDLGKEKEKGYLKECSAFRTSGFLERAKIKGPVVFGEDVFCLHLQHLPEAG